MSEYKATIGLEIHAELNTVTKMFCNSKNDPDEKRPNVNICPICMGYPGTLPLVNFEAVKNVIKVGCAVGGEIADYTEFDRKNYFYPDIPKGYQISQYKFPLVKGGSLNGVELTRIHLEEDTARSTHESGNYSLIDFNRAGVPLMELVTEPVIHSAEEASKFAKELQLLLQTLGVAEANMEKGEMRVEANISISKTDKFGTKVEVKNLNSFKAVEKAIAYEVERHTKLLEEGKEVVQETRGWDEDKQITFSQRTKEDSHDYRYFPDPDIPKIVISEVPELSPEKIKKELPELPWEKRERYKSLGLEDGDIVWYIYDPTTVGMFFDKVIELLDGDTSKIKLASNYISNDIMGGKVTNSFSLPKPEHYVELIDMSYSGELSSRATKDILAIMLKQSKSPREIAEENDLFQKSDEGELKSIAEKIIGENPDVVSQYKSGKTSVIQFFVGQGMKATKGAGNPEVLRKVFEELLS